jgi:hypothetical protein
MKQNTTITERKNHLAYALDKLNDQDQAYLETLTAQLAKIHGTSPETQRLTGKKPKSKVQQTISEDTSMPDQTETKIPWDNDTITIKGRNAGIEALTVHFGDEQLNIIDFLNTSLNADYAVHYETIMSAYEAKLKTGSIFDHNFPEAAFAVRKIDPSQLRRSLPAADTELIEILLVEYNICLDYLRKRFKEYETVVAEWFNRLSEEEKKV